MARELILVIALAVAAGYLLGSKPRNRRVGAWAAGVALAVVLLVIAAGRLLPLGQVPPIEKPEASPVEFLQDRPREVSSDGYVSSYSCQECHGQNHATWFASYHRRMTQVASPESVFGNFDDQTVTYSGASYHLQRRGEQYWVEMDNPDQGPGIPPRIERPIVMTTGSHHMQVYWYPTGHSRVLGQLPIFFLKPEKKWVPRDAAFLRPPDDQHGSESGRWNVKCVFCHATHGQPEMRNQTTMDTQVAEFGIACEACHGPGEKHVRRQRAIKAGGQPPVGPDSIVDPQDLTHQLSAQVCGQCHSVNMPYDQRQVQIQLVTGSAFRPGQKLSDVWHVVKRNEESATQLGKFFGDVSGHFDKQFWADGMIRVSGREYSGISGSACHTSPNGGLSCVSCHVMHPAATDSRPLEQWADDQLKPEMRGNQACVQCHQAGTYATPLHTHHPVASSGSECQNCHMPHTSYGLLKATRSHQISSPDVTTDITVGRPNACNLCHLDQTLAWTSDHLAQWYGNEKPTLTPDQQTVSAAVLWTLSGDAGQRGLLAWHLGWKPAVEASGADWLPVWLATLLKDSYNSIRLVALRSLRTDPRFADFVFDYMDDDRDVAAQRVLTTWRSEIPSTAPPRPALLLGPGGAIDQPAYDRLLQQRDTRPVQLAE